MGSCQDIGNLMSGFLHQQFLVIFLFPLIHGDSPFQNLYYGYTQQQLQMYINKWESEPGMSISKMIVNGDLCHCKVPSPTPLLPPAPTTPLPSDNIIRSLSFSLQSGGIGSMSSSAEEILPIVGTTQAVGRSSVQPLKITTTTTPTTTKTTTSTTTSTTVTTQKLTTSTTKVTTTTTTEKITTATTTTLRTDTVTIQSSTSYNGAVKVPIAPLTNEETTNVPPQSSVSNRNINQNGNINQ